MVFGFAESEAQMVSRVIGLLWEKRKTDSDIKNKDNNILFIKAPDIDCFVATLLAMTWGSLVPRNDKLVYSQKLKKLYH